MFDLLLHGTINDNIKFQLWNMNIYDWMLVKFHISLITKRFFRSFDCDSDKTVDLSEYPEWPHRQGGCLACCGCTFESRWGLHWFILCKWRSVGTAHEGGGCDQSIGSTVSDAIVRSWLWLTATSSSPLGCFSTLLQVVDNWPHILW